MAMWISQDGVCAICRRPETFITTGQGPCRLSVDHDHKTGKVRGLLCRDCNVGLGNFGDSGERLRNAAAYLGQAGRTAEAEAVAEAARKGFSGG